MPVIDLAFGLQGDTIPVDHGYALYSAVSRVLPCIHADEHIGIHPVNGRLAGNRLLAITPASRMTLRIPAERITDFLPLAGVQMAFGDHTIRVGAPTPFALKPKAGLYSRLVIIKGFTEPEGFLAAVIRQLVEAGVRGRASLVEQSHVAAANADREGGAHSPVLRRTLRIRDKDVVGFAVRINELTADESILVQERGIGGRRRFGCGVFMPDRR